MWIALCHALLCSFVGGVIAVVAGALWQLIFRLVGDGAAALEWLPLLGLAVLGAAVGGLAGGVLSAIYQARLRHLQSRAIAPPSAAASLASLPPVAIPAAKPAPARSRRRRRLVARLSPRGQWEAISKPLARLLARQAGKLRGRPVAEVLHPEDQVLLEKTLRQAQMTRQPQTLTCRFIVPVDRHLAHYAQTTFRTDTQLVTEVDPASVRHVRARVRARPSGFLCRFVDQSPRLAHEQALKHMKQEADDARLRWRGVNADLNRLKESYLELYHHAPVMYFSLDVDGRLVTFNNTLIRTLGYRRRHLHGHPYQELLDQDASAADESWRRRPPFEEGEVKTRWRTRNGGALDIWIRTVAVRDEHGGFVRYRSAALDLTEKNRLASELRRRGDELEREKERLRAINAELELFTHVVSHDLKEPLRTMQTYGTMLADEYSAQLGADGFLYINHLIRASRRLERLINDLREMSQAGRITRSSAPFDLIEAVATARNDLVDLIQRREAIVLTEGSLPRVVGDRDRIVQLLTNLIANGLKYNRNPQPQVVIAAAPAADNPHEIVACVRDNGIGIDRAFHDQIFRIFRRLHQADEYEGTGAGLAICKKIVEAHGGRIWVESEPGKGATFFFTLPDTQTTGQKRMPAGREAPVSDGPPSPPRIARLPTRSGPHVVLVEDDEDTALIIQDQGGKAGFSITWFPSAEEAWEYLQQNQPDFLLFDIRLPGMSGVDLCRRVRTLPTLHGTPVALFQSDQDPDALRAAGADFLLSKDLLKNPAVWQKRLKEVLDQSRQPQPS
jgi:PAS domain S-box-containing protein